MTIQNKILEQLDSLSKSIETISIDKSELDGAKLNALRFKKRIQTIEERNLYLESLNSNLNNAFAGAQQELRFLSEENSTQKEINGRLTKEINELRTINSTILNSFFGKTYTNYKSLKKNIARKRRKFLSLGKMTATQINNNAPKGHETHPIPVGGNTPIMIRTNEIISILTAKMNTSEK
ncbi:hypothetical protein [Brevundimonas sp.]|uniref:hypothetical protein n=1 Tax=Brevundimonas sp. TaxID=1871086 RepID=UPI002FC83865